jgi:hypothetical protein
MVRVEVTVPPAGTVIGLGLNVQEINWVFAEHQGLRVPLKPLTEFMVTVNVAELPGLTGALVGLTV